MNRKLFLLKFLILIALFALTLSACGGKAGASTDGSTSGKPTVDILYLNHPPVRDVLTKIDPILASYGDQLKVSRYDFDTPEGAAFAEEKGIKEHMPLIIYINGSNTFDLDGQKITFESFPQGEGTAVMAAGLWTLADLDAALKKATGN
jgi:hypothetical protein